MSLGLVEGKRDPTHSVGILHQHQDGLAVLLAVFLQTLLNVLRRGDRFLLDLDDDVTGLHAAAGGGAVGLDVGHDDALLIGRELVLVAQGVGDRGELGAEARQHRRAVTGNGGRVGGRTGLLDLVGQFAGRGGQVDLLVVAPDGDGDLLADVGLGDDARQRAHLFDVLIVEFQDDVAVVDTGLVGGATVVHAGDHGAGDVLQADRFGDVGGDLLDADAKPSAAGMAVFAELHHHALGEVGRDRKADADRAAGGGVDGGVDADDVAVHVEQRATGVAAVDGGVGLDEVVVGALADVAAAGGDDTGGDGAAEAEGIADREHPVADALDVAIAELDGGQRVIGGDLEEGEVDAVILADQGGLQGGVVGQGDADLVGAVDYVVVGDDVAGRIDDEARAERNGAAGTGTRAIIARRRLAFATALALIATRIAAGMVAIHEVAEELLERRAGWKARDLGTAVSPGLDLLRRRDVDDGRR